MTSNIVSAYDKIRVYEIPSRLIKSGENNIISVRIKGRFKGQSGPYKDKFLLGNYQSLSKELFLWDLFDILFIIGYFVVSIYFALFFFRRRVDLENLMFSLFTISISIYFIFML